MKVTEPEAAESRLNFDREQTLGQVADLEREFAAIVASAADGSAGSDDGVIRRAPPSRSSGSMSWRSSTGRAPT